MFITLKIIHLLSLFVGGGAGIGNAVLMKKIEASGGPPPPIVGESMGVLAKMGLGAVVLMWLTGIGMAFSSGAANTVGWEFYVKLLGAAGLLGAVSGINLVRARAIKAGQPPNMATMKKLAKVAQISVLTALIFAVIAFN